MTNQPEPTAPPAPADRAAEIRAAAFKTAALFVRGHSADERYGKASISTALCAMSDALLRMADEARLSGAPAVTSHAYEGDERPAPLSPGREQEIRETHPGSWYSGPWTQDYVDSNGDEPAYCRVVHHESGTTLATLPDFAGTIALFIADAHDAVPELLSELDRVRAERNRYAAELDRRGLERWEDQQTPAVLRQAADALDKSERLRDLTDDHMHDVHAAANELRRMADGYGPAPTDPTRAVLEEVRAERQRQDEKWGEQNHPDGTGLPIYQHSARRYRDHAERAAASGHLAWRDVLLEEVHEALAEDDATALRAELLQVAAVAVAWVEAIGRRAAAPAEGSDH